VRGAGGEWDDNVGSKDILIYKILHWKKQYFNIRWGIRAIDKLMISTIKLKDSM
jgi:hypothetical protein